MKAPMMLPRTVSAAAIVGQRFSRRRDEGERSLEPADIFEEHAREASKLTQVADGKTLLGKRLIIEESHEDAPLVYD